MAIDMVSGCCWIYYGTEAMWVKRSAFFFVSDDEDEGDETKDKAKATLRYDIRNRLGELLTICGGVLLPSTPFLALGLGDCLRPNLEVSFVKDKFPGHETSWAWQARLNDFRACCKRPS